MKRTFGRRSERGQSLLLFGAVAPVLLMGAALVLDVGWGYFVSKKAQTASDAAAMAGVNAVLQQVGPGGVAPTCGAVGCQAADVCPVSGNLHSACQFATVNGFVDGGDDGRQTFRIAADTSTYAPGQPNVPVSYWVQASAQDNLPQWFSGLISNSNLKPTALSTAAIRSVNLDGSIYLLNHSSDCFASALNIGVVCGEDFLALGSNSVQSTGGIYMASGNATGLGLPAIAAGTVAVGNVTVSAPFTSVYGNGGVQQILGSTNWSGIKNGFSDESLFSDPMGGKAQPPAPTGLQNHPVPNGLVTQSLLGGSAVLAPGNYYSTILGIPSGLPITIAGDVVFSDGQNPPCGGFCNYVFYGGLVITGNVTFSPGRYVFAGAQPVAGGPGVGLSVGVSASIKDRTPLVNGQAQQNTDAGEIFIFTDTNYPGLHVPVSLAGLSFPQARAGVVAGLGATVTLHGLNASNPNLPSELAPYAPVLIWQDRANTTLKYTSTGLLDRSCGSICSNILSVPGTQQMVIQGSQQGGNPGVNLYGTIYGPRGSWLTILGLFPGDGVAGPLQIITGALQMAVNSSLSLQSLSSPPTHMVASLIQ